MKTRQMIVVTALAVFFILLILELIRRHRMRERYSLLWFFIGLGAISVPLLYALYARMARLLGFVEVNNLFFFLSIIALFLLCLQFSIALSSSFNRTKVLVQCLGLLENRLRQLESQLQAEPPPQPKSPPPPDTTAT